MTTSELLLLAFLVCFCIGVTSIGAKLDAILKELRK
jgi:hypothetical protein